MSIRSCTCSSNLTDFLLIRQKFVFFIKSGRKGLRYPGWEKFHGSWSSIFEKWGDIILNLLFGSCFTKHLVLGTRKMENEFSVGRNGKLPPATLFSISRCTCVQNTGTFITNYVVILAIILVIWVESHETSNMIVHFEKVF